MSVREEAYGVENMERNNWGVGGWQLGRSNPNH